MICAPGQTNEFPPGFGNIDFALLRISVSEILDVQSVDLKGV